MVTTAGCFTPSPSIPDAGSDAGQTGPIAVPGDAPYDTWTWLPFPGALCGNGTPTGMGINPHAGSQKLLIYFNGGGSGGGMCFDYPFCFTTPSASFLNGFNKGNFTQSTTPPDGILSGGFFKRDDLANPFASYNFVVFPYCTGDLHSGSAVHTYPNPDGGAPGTIHHVGYQNATAYLQRVVPTFAGVQQVVVAGSSSGGFGALFNYGRIREAFRDAGSAEVQLVDDSFAPLRPQYWPASYQQQISSTWGSVPSLPSDCPACDPNAGPDAGFFQLIPFYARDPAFRGSLISSNRDEILSLYLAGFPPYGNPWLYCSPDGGSTCDTYPAVQDLYAATIAPLAPGKFKVFFIDSYRDGWANSSPGSTATDAGTLSDFLGQQLSDSPSWTSVNP